MRLLASIRSCFLKNAYQNSNSRLGVPSTFAANRFLEINHAQKSKCFQNNIPALMHTRFVRMSSSTFRKGEKSNLSKFTLRKSRKATKLMSGWSSSLHACLVSLLCTLMSSTYIEAWSWIHTKRFMILINYRTKTKSWKNFSIPKTKVLRRVKANWIIS